MCEQAFRGRRRSRDAGCGVVQGTSDSVVGPFLVCSPTGAAVNAPCVGLSCCVIIVPMTGQDDHITYFARTNHRNTGRVFGIRQRDRRSHFYCCGKTGTGKSWMLRTMLAQDIVAGQGCALFDPHGDLVREVLPFVPLERQPDLLFLDVPEASLSLRFNPLAGIAPHRRALATTGFVEVLKKLWPDDWGPRLEHLVRNVFLTLLEAGQTSLASIPALLTDREYRKEMVARVETEAVREFWQKEYERYSPAFRAVVVAPLQNKIGALLADPHLHRILVEDGEQLNIREVMDCGKILLVNLDKGKIGEGPSALLGSFLLSHIALAGISRSDQPPETRRDFFTYLDEFQTFTTLSIASMLSELRKFGVGMVLAHQHLSQLDHEVRDAVFGNAGTVVSFRVGAADAAFLGREFSPDFDADDLISLPRYHIYLRLQIDGEASRPFSAVTIGRLEDIPGWSPRWGAQEHLHARDTVY